MINLERFPFLFAWMLSMTGFVNAQTFQSQAEVDSVYKSGFYAIDVTPLLSSQVKTDFRDLRIREKNGGFVPYILGNDIPGLDSNQYKLLRLLVNTVTDSGQSIIIVENMSGDTLDELNVRIKNTAVSRSMNVSGGSDGVHWFSIVENLNLGRRFIQDRDQFIENISFPLSTYKYYRITICNGKNDPLDIMSVYKRNRSVVHPKPLLIANPASGFKQKDSAKYSWIEVENPGRFHISQVSIKVKGPMFFQRPVDIFAGELMLGNFNIASNSALNADLPTFNDSVFTVRIYNEDNQPLEVTSVYTAQVEEKIITYLNAGKSYLIVMSSPDATPPRYDLLNFKDSIPKAIYPIGFSKLSRTFIPEKQESTFMKGWLWPALVFTLLVLGLFTYNLVKDLSNKS